MWHAGKQGLFVQVSVNARRVRLSWRRQCEFGAALQGGRCDRLLRKEPIRAGRDAHTGSRGQTPRANVPAEMTATSAGRSVDRDLPPPLAPVAGHPELAPLAD